MKSDKVLNVLERRAVTAARAAERAMDGRNFVMRYHPLFSLSALPWCVLIVAIAVLLQVIDAVWPAVLCYVLGGLLLLLMLDWLLWRATVDETGITVCRLLLIKRRLQRSQLDGVRLQGQQRTEGQKLILHFGDKKAEFVPEMIGFALLQQWAKQK